MSVSQHESILRQGPRHWNEWRNAAPDTTPDLSGVTLDNLDLSPFNLRGVIFDKATFTRCQCVGLDLAGTSLVNVVLSDTNFDAANLTGARLDGAEIKKCRFNNDVQARGIRLDDASIIGCSFIEADLAEACFESAKIADCSFTDATLQGATFATATLTKVSAIEANLKRTVFERASLTDCVFERALATEANLKKVVVEAGNFTGMGLSNASMSGCSLHGTNLARAMLIDADLSGSILFKVEFKDAFLTRADLSNAKLNGATFDGATLAAATFDRADFHHADLSGASVRGTSLKNARGLYGQDKAILSGIVDDAWAIYSGRWDKASWWLLRFIGTFRLFAVSYTAVIGIIIYANLARWYNDSADNSLLWLERFKLEHDWVPLAWLEQLPRLGAPWTLSVQLIALVLMAIGATLYAWYCPDLVKENTETKWTRELKQPLIEYRSAMYSRRWARIVCSFGYCLGGAYTVTYLAWRSVDALLYLLSLA